jgi:hypothetical protein
MSEIASARPVEHARRPASAEEDERAGLWLRHALNERPKPHAACGDIEDALVERICRGVRRLRGTEELWHLSRLIDEILERARAQA